MEYKRQDQGRERVWVVPSQEGHRSVLVIGINIIVRRLL